MRTFVKLANTNASGKIFMRTIKMTPRDVLFHVQYMGYYLLFIELSDKIIKLTKKRELARPEDKDALFKEIRDLQLEYNPRLMEARKK